MSDDHLFLNRQTIQFLTVFEMQSLHKAADTLRISQPALSVGIRNLEEKLGAPLFERTSKGMEPTAIGQAFYHYATAARQTGRTAIEEVRARDSGELGTLRLGAGVAFTTTVLPPILRRLRDRYPGLTVDLLSGVGDQLAPRFLEGEIDVLLASTALPGLDAPGIRRQYLTNLPMYAFCDAGSVLARRTQVTPADLLTVGWAGFYEDESSIHAAAHYMGLHGLPPPRTAIRSNSVAALTAFVGGTDLVLILVSRLLDHATKAGLVQLPLAVPLWEIPVSLYLREVAATSPIAAAFVDAVQDEFRCGT
ncbi:LysR family transcriptional regulator [uncultured Jannaschia sp.]|uniref:LysR family transcriptional regulator n=1 Tax=uncultured Jannaschia sp. TaxID=293347 RepID=UPI00262349E3|nr:LysR family transcriptional regulator [uncultured Jannaschia sp.]